MALYLRKRAALVRFFSARTSSPSEAEDIVQEIYLKLAQATETPSSPEAFLYRLGANVMIDRARTRRRSAARDDAYYQTFRRHGHAGNAADAPDPDAAIDARSSLMRIMKVVEKLPPQCRRVFLMHKVEERSYAEVASALNISRSAVEKHMINALKRLAEQRQ